VYNQFGVHGKVMYLLDIWLGFGDAGRDSRIKALKRKLMKRLWGLGFSGYRGANDRVVVAP